MFRAAILVATLATAGLGEPIVFEQLGQPYGSRHRSQGVLIPADSSCWLRMPIWKMIQTFIYRKVSCACLGSGYAASGSSAMAAAGCAATAEAASMEGREAGSGASATVLSGSLTGPAGPVAGLGGLARLGFGAGFGSGFGGEFWQQFEFGRERRRQYFSMRQMYKRQPHDDGMDQYGKRDGKGDTAGGCARTHNGKAAVTAQK